MAEQKPIPDRPPPKRLITKKQGLRQIIHSSIRLTFAGEDPFAIHLLGQSAEKVCLDLLKRAGIPDPFDIGSTVYPEYKKAFLTLYREPYNFLKHADRDHDGQLPIYDLVGANDMLISFCVLRYSKLFGEVTTHMVHFRNMMMTIYPNIFHWDRDPRFGVLLEQRRQLTNITRGDLLMVFGETLGKNKDYERERAEDLVDIVEANQRVVENVREGRT